LTFESSFFSDIKSSKKTLSVDISDFLQETMNELDILLNENNLDALDNINIIGKLENNFKHYVDKIEASPIQDNHHKDENSLKSEDSIPKSKDKSSDKENRASIVNSQNSNFSNTQTVRITSDKLDNLLLKSESLIKVKQMFQENINHISKLTSMLDNIKQNHSKTQSDLIFLKQHLKNTTHKDRRSTRRPLNELAVFLDNLDMNLKELNNSLKNLGDIEKENFRDCEKMIDNFLHDIKAAAMLPFSNILSVFPRMVKDIAKELKKDINFQIVGEDNQIDRRILQEIKDPLIHLVRNCIDHGIELPEERKNKNKSPKGNIQIYISQEKSNQLELIIKDDGKGINEDTIKSKILNEKLINDKRASELTKEELIDHLFQSGFSTKDIITDISGRGLGLAIVKERLEKLGGKIEIVSEINKGTTTKLQLPVALSTFKGVLFEINKRHFAIPSINVEKIIRIKDPVIKMIENRKSVVYHENTYPLIDLALALELPSPSRSDDDEVSNENTLTAIIVEKNNKHMALEIDDIIEEQEMLVKDLGSQLKKVNNISGATILNSGEIVPILNILDLFFTAQNINYINTGKNRNSSEKTNESDHNKTGPYNLLVVEDSITSRILLKNILESAGYNVETAVDGIAALTLLKTQKIDLVVSDIEMPRMDGIALTKKIKSDEILSLTPVILVTSLSTDADRESGIDAGANAYIVKSNFDQSNLLGAIESLI
jgi:two-component system, chemotaxis family, sensor kinase CheA